MTGGGGGPSKSPWHRGVGRGVHPSQIEAQSKACRDKGERKDGGGRVRDKEIGGDDLNTTACKTEESCIMLGQN